MKAEQEKMLSSAIRDQAKYGGTLAGNLYDVRGFTMRLQDYN